MNRQGVGPYQTDEARRSATQAVLKWIEERHGGEAAGIWAMSCTPIPCGLPDDEMLEDGLSLAVGEVTLGALLAKTEAEMERMSRLYSEEYLEEASDDGSSS